MQLLHQSVRYTETVAGIILNGQAMDNYGRFFFVEIWILEYYTKDTAAIVLLILQQVANMNS